MGGYGDLPELRRWFPLERRPRRHATVDPASPLFNISRSPFLVPSTGYEVGIRNRSIAGLETSLALFRLDFASENLFQATPAPPSRAGRPAVSASSGATTTRSRPWLRLGRPDDHQRALLRPRPRRPARAGGTDHHRLGGRHLRQGQGWFGSLRFRYFGPRPLIEDNSVRSKPTALLNGRIGYAFDNGVSLALDVLNLTNARADQITYYYESRLPGEAAAVADRHFHPVEPTAVRLTLAGGSDGHSWLRRALPSGADPCCPTPSTISLPVSGSRSGSSTPS